MNIRTATLAALVLTGCTHAPRFERENSPAAIGPGPEIRPPASVALVVSRSMSPRFRRELEHALALEGSLAVVSTGSDPDYVLRIDVERRARPSARNFFICWPGFIVFAPAWHGLRWPYSLDTRIAIDRHDGGLVADYGLEGRWTAHYTPRRYGLAAGLGWCFVVYTVPALQAGIASSVQRPDTQELDAAFVREEGELWADEVIATIVARIARDRRTHPPRPLE